MAANSSLYQEYQSQGPGGSMNLLNILGASKSLTPGQGLFMVKSITVSVAASFCFGAVSMMLLGPGLPFLGGATFGFVGGMIHRWRTDLKETKFAMQSYPELMEFHVKAVEPDLFRRQEYSRWVLNWERNMYKQGLCIIGMYGATPAIARLTEQVEERIVAKILDQQEEGKIETSQETGFDS